MVLFCTVSKLKLLVHYLNEHSYLDNDINAYIHKVTHTCQHYSKPKLGILRQALLEEALSFTVVHLTFNFLRFFSTGIKVSQSMCLNT